MNWTSFSSKKKAECKALKRNFLYTKFFHSKFCSVHVTKFTLRWGDWRTEYAKKLFLAVILTLNIVPEQNNVVNIKKFDDEDWHGALHRTHWHTPREQCLFSRAVHVWLLTFKWPCLTIKKKHCNNEHKLLTNRMKCPLDLHFMPHLLQNNYLKRSCRKRPFILKHGRVNGCGDKFPSSLPYSLNW